MKKYLSALMFGLLVTSNAHAWIPSGDVVTIDEVYIWNSNSQIYFKLSSGYICYVPADEKNAYSLILSLYMSGKKASIHCFDTEESVGGINGHRLHRIIALKS